MDFPNLNNQVAVGGRLHVVPDTTTVKEMGLYATGTEMLWLPGTRYSPDERSFVYGKNGGTNAIIPGYGCAFKLAYLDVDAGLNKAIAIGDTSLYIAVDAGTATAFGTADRMKGGYFSRPAGTITQFRRIIDHEIGSSGAVIRIDVDGPFTFASDAAAFIELMQNPWWSMGYPQEENANYSGKGGIATTTIAAGSFGWFQTWGPCWGVPELPVADETDRRTVFFGGGGELRGGTDVTVENGFQTAGYVIDSTGSGSDNPPFVFLQISR